ncbi:MAG: hypothetical protein K5989_03250 [Lachnospiraceae bacterium]|nr:hypothetical protein [Lachnospiraceae bacterium]
MKIHREAMDQAAKPMESALSAGRDKTGKAVESALSAGRATEAGAKNFPLRMHRGGRKGMCLLLSSILAMGLLLTGCGGAPMQLTDEERNSVVNYAVDVLNAHNINKGKTLVNVSEKDLKAILLEQDPELAAALSEEEPAPVQQEQPQEQQEESPEEQAISGNSGGNSGGELAEDVNHADLSELAGMLGQSGFNISYGGYDVVDSYPPPSEDGVMNFTIEPASDGDKLLILHLTVTNTGDSEANCDILSTDAKFRFSLNGQVHSFQNTLLLDDFSTLLAPIAGGESIETVLVAEVSEEKLTDVQSLSLILREETGDTVFDLQ